MHEEEWVRFAAGEGPEWRSVCRVEPFLAAAAGSGSNLVRVRRDYVHKVLRHHNFDYYHLGMIGITIEFGAAFLDKERHLTFFYEDRALTGHFLKACVKANRRGDELVLCTFHRAEPGGYKARFKRKPLLRGFRT